MKTQGLYDFKVKNVAKVISYFKSNVESKIIIKIENVVLGHKLVIFNTFKSKSNWILEN